MKRRFFLRALAAAPVMAPAAGTMSSEQGWGLRQAIAAMPHSGGLNPPSSPSESDWSARNLLAKPFRKLLEQQNEARSFDFAFRTGPFEPDLCALRSISHCARVAYQKGRDRQRMVEPKSLQERIAQIMGWDA